MARTEDTARKFTARAARKSAVPISGHIYAALKDGNVSKIKKYLDSCSHDINYHYGYYDPSMLLHVACIHGNVESISLLLEKGADINATTLSYGYTPLHLLCQRKKWTEKFLKTTDGGAQFRNCVNLLVKNGADIHSKSKEGKTALDYARNKIVKTIVEEILEEDEDDLDSDFYSESDLDSDSDFYNPERKKRRIPSSRRRIPSSRTPSEIPAPAKQDQQVLQKKKIRIPKFPDEIKQDKDDIDVKLGSKRKEVPKNSEEPPRKRQRASRLIQGEKNQNENPPGNNVSPVRKRKRSISVDKQSANESNMYNDAPAKKKLKESSLPPTILYMDDGLGQTPYHPDAEAFQNRRIEELEEKIKNLEEETKKLEEKNKKQKTLLEYYEKMHEQDQAMMKKQEDLYKKRIASSEKEHEEQEKFYKEKISFVEKVRDQLLQEKIQS